MREEKGDIWQLRMDAQGWIGVTTNGIVKKTGNAVMGKGIALQAATYYPHLPRELAKHLQLYGNVPMFTVYKVFTFPTKNHWTNPSIMGLIEKSSRILAHYAKQHPNETFYLPRPGCGNGQLLWDDVKKVIEPILPDNVIVVSY